MNVIMIFFTFYSNQQSNSYDKLMYVLMLIKDRTNKIIEYILASQPIKRIIVSFIGLNIKSLVAEIFCKFYAIIYAGKLLITRYFVNFMQLFMRVNLL